MEFEISCRYHGKLEKLIVPESYGQHGFVGEVRCGDSDDNRISIIKIPAHGATTDPGGAVTARLDSVERT